MIVIPAINANTFEELQEKVKLVEPYVDSIHLDVADGAFTKNTIWHNPSDLAGLDTNLNIEVHLMLNDIDNKINDWLLPNINRIIFHLSASRNPDFVISEIKKAGKDVGISISPDESLEEALKYIDRVFFFQILGVYPGLAGQKTLESAYDRIKEVRDSCPSCIIECDGGMNKETAKRAVEAGADIITAASAVFEGGNAGENIRRLEEI
jgi:ribulose-phosphate 3-epimerase